MAQYPAGSSGLYIAKNVAGGAYNVANENGVQYSDDGGILSKVSGLTSSFNSIIGPASDFNTSAIIQKLMKSIDYRNNPTADKEAKVNIESREANGRSKSILGQLSDLTYGVLRALISPVVGMIGGLRAIYGYLTGSMTGDAFVDSQVASAISAQENAPEETETGSGSSSKSSGGITGWFSNAWQTVKDGWNNIFNPSGTGSGIHVSQKDIRYAGRKFGRYTIGKNGCGPAVAATVLRSYGKNASLGDTAAYAQANGFVAGSSGVGTRAGYFKSILGANGIRSRYMTSRKSISSAVGSGHPTILLGQDGSNRSKANSPFGPNPHYVVAQGKDRHGNIVVDDPELGSTAIYNKNILNNAKLGIMTGGDSGIDPNSVETQVYQYFTSNGFSPAATAGIMGNIWRESNFKPDAIEDSGNGPAAGLFQWMSWSDKNGRWKAMSDHAASKGKDWTDLQSQLEYALSEMGGSENWAWKNYSSKTGISSFDEFKKMTDPQDAANAFMVSFERPAASTSAIDKRKAHAIEYYEKYANSQYTGSSPSFTTTGGYNDYLGKYIQD